MGATRGAGRRRSWTAVAFAAAMAVVVTVVWVTRRSGAPAQRPAVVGPPLRRRRQRPPTSPAVTRFAAAGAAAVVVAAALAVTGATRATPTGSLVGQLTSSVTGEPIPGACVAVAPAPDAPVTDAPPPTETEPAAPPAGDVAPAEPEATEPRADAEPEPGSAEEPAPEPEAVEPAPEPAPAPEPSPEPSPEPPPEEEASTEDAIPASAVVASAVTDDDGSFRIDGVPVGDVVVVAEDCDPARAAEGEMFLPAATDGTVEEGEESEASLVLDEGAFIRGRVTTPEGTGALCSVFVGTSTDSLFFATSTDAAGEYEAGPFAPGSYFLAFPDCVDPGPIVVVDDVPAVATAAGDEYVGVYWPGAPGTGVVDPAAAAPVVIDPPPPPVEELPEIDPGGGLDTADGEPPSGEAEEVEEIDRDVNGIDVEVFEGGTITGFITTDTDSSAPDCVNVYQRVNGSRGLASDVASGFASGGGFFRLTRVQGGDAVLEFDPSCESDFLTEFWNDRPEVTCADPVPVEVGATTSEINPELSRTAPPPCPDDGPTEGPGDPPDVVIPPEVVVEEPPRFDEVIEPEIDVSEPIDTPVEPVVIPDVRVFGTSVEVSPNVVPQDDRLDQPEEAAEPEPEPVDELPPAEDPAPPRDRTPAADPVGELEVELLVPSAPPGGELALTGSGCEPGAPVDVEVDGVRTAAGRADADGTFDITGDLPELAIGRHEVVVSCGAAAGATTVDVVLTAADAADGQSGMVLAFFTMLGVVLLHRRPTPTYAVPF